MWLSWGVDTMQLDRESWRPLRRAASQRLLRMHFESGVGHIGGNLSASTRCCPLPRAWAPRPFVLSKGHAAGALYIALWTVGRLEEDDLATFHKEARCSPAIRRRLGSPRSVRDREPRPRPLRWPRARAGRG